MKLALEPEWEAKFEPNSYGFRPGRSAHDAIGAIFIAIEKQPKYVLDADIAKCFDRIDQTALLCKTGTYPGLRRLIKSWLKAGVLDQGVVAETASGTPQGGVASPLLANIALHGLEAHIRGHFPAQVSIGPPGKRHAMNWKPQLIRYADDFVILHRDKAVIEHCQRLAAEWLHGIGLELSPTKTRIAHTLHPEGGEAGFNFLGFNVRQYPTSKYNSGGGRGFKTLIKPSKDAIQRHYRKLADLIGQHQAARQENLIGLLNPVIAGWSHYYSAVVSKAVFQKLDQQLYSRLARWARYRHPRKAIRWIIRRYWSVDQGQGWRFAAPTGVALNAHASVPIVRHTKVRGAASPFDGNWSYWATRRGTYPGLPRRMAALFESQRGRCPACGLFFTPDALVELHHRDGNHGNNRYRNLAAVHRHCHDQIHGGQGEFSRLRGTHDKSPVN